MPQILTPRELFDQLRLEWLDSYIYEDFALKQQIQSEFQEILASNERALAYKWNGTYYKKQILSNAVPDLEARWLGNKVGYGLFTRSTLAKGAYIGSYLGRVRKKSPFRSEFINSYSFNFPVQPYSWLNRWGWGWVIDALKQGNHTRFINHDSEGNCESTGAICQDEVYIIIRAKRAIKAGEQLLYDYGQSYWSRRKPSEDLIKTNFEKSL